MIKTAIAIAFFTASAYADAPLPICRAPTVCPNYATGVGACALTGCTMTGTLAGAGITATSIINSGASSVAGTLTTTGGGGIANTYGITTATFTTTGAATIGGALAINGAATMTNVALTATGASGNIISAASMTASGFFGKSLVVNGAGGISQNVLGTSTIAFSGGGVGYIPYTLTGTTTTTTAGGEVYFSTLTVPANMFNKAGQTLRITCDYWTSANANSKLPKIEFNNSGPLTSIGTGGSTTGSNLNMTVVAELTWISASLWTDRAFGWTSSSVFNTPPGTASTPRGTQTFNEANPMTFNCTCTAATANGDCSFLGMRVEWLGMGQ